MRVVFNAQMDPKLSGGIAQVVLGLAHGLGNLAGAEEYVFICSPTSAEWLQPYLGMNQRIVINRAVKPAPAGHIRTSDGFWESFKPDVIHFPYQAFTYTEVPSVFNPHDLQHVHLPDYFTSEERRRRDAVYGEACRLATAVVTASRFVKDDVVRRFGVAEKKVHVVGWGSPTAAYPRFSENQAREFLIAHRIPGDFALYPAQTWPHKNHLRLIEALHILRTRHQVQLPLVCTGALTDHYDAVAARVNKLGLTEQVRFLGRVDERSLVALFEAAEFLVVPTLFEAMSFPILEAFAEGLPVACSNVTSLPEQVGDAGLIFDPRDEESIAQALLSMHTDADLRRDLAARGFQRAKSFSWTATAEHYRSIYRAVAMCGGGDRGDDPVSGQPVVCGESPPGHLPGTQTR